jgi:uncharacterized LabA/DUF88 family protein
MTLARVNFYVDGFNFYHALKDLIKLGGDTENYLKWLSIRGVCEQILFDNEKLNEIFFFTSAPTHKKQDIQDRHQKFLQATAGSGVKVIKGQFKKRHMVQCDNCSHSWPRYDEKETDVNLAVKVIVDAYENRFDKCLVVSNDTDMKSVAEVITRKFRNLEYVCVSPIDVEKRPFSIINPLDLKHRTITKEHILQNLMPEFVPDANGGFVKRPIQYAPNSIQASFITYR